MSSEIRCPKCGAVNSGGSSFCTLCGGPLSAAAPAPAAPQSQPYPGQPSPQPGYQGQPGPQQPYPGQGYPPGAAPGAPYGVPPQGPQSNKATIALILGVVGLVLCGPFTAAPGIFLAKQDLDAMKRGELSTQNQTLAQVAFWLNIGVCALFVLGICAVFSLGGLGFLTSLGNLG